MRRRPITLFAALCLGLVATGRAQRTTERYIPLGQSPGLSGKVTLIGTVAAFDDGRRSVSVQSPAGTQAVQLTDATRLWLDRSAAKQPSVSATAAELRLGRRVEVKFADPGGRGNAEWIKIDAATP